MNVVVIGAGLAGLLAGAELTRRGAKVTVLEASDDIAGVARTVAKDGYLLEPAVGSFMLPHPALTPILEAAGTDVIERRGPDLRYFSDGSGFTALPGDPTAFLRSPAISAKGKLRAVAEPLVRSKSHPDESLSRFLTRRLGREAGGLVAELAAAGVFGGDPSLIDAAAYAPLVGLERAHGSLIGGMVARRRTTQTNPQPKPTAHFPAAGMYRLATDLASFIGDVRMETSVRTIESGGDGIQVDGSSTDAVVIACPPEHAPLLNGARAPLEEAPRLAVAVVFVGGTPNQLPLPEGFGLLVGGGADTPVLGVVLDNGPASAPKGHRLAKTLLGGWRADIAAWSDDEIIEATIAHLSRIFQVDIQPQLCHVERRSIPQYLPGHTDRTATTSWPDCVYATGWTQRGIGMSSLAVEAVAIANKVTTTAA